MGIKTLSTSLKKEVQVPDTNLIVQEEKFAEERNYHVKTKKESIELMDEFDCINLYNINDDDDDEDGDGDGDGDAEDLGEGHDVYHQPNYWEGLMPWDDGFPINEKAGEGYQSNYFDNSSCMSSQEDGAFSIKKEAEYAFLDDDDEKKLSLNLSLNYQEVLDAWSDRTLWADDSSFPSANNAYMGEVPVVEEERRRREASVLRYKEKRHTRLFSKKIRYQVRKLNADKRPRLKGRFVKRVAEKMHK